MSLTNILDSPKKFKEDPKENLLWAYERFRKVENEKKEWPDKFETKLQYELFGYLGDIDSSKINIILNRIAELITEYGFDPREEEIFWNYFKEIKKTLLEEIKKKLKEKSETFLETLDKVDKFCKIIKLPIEDFLVNELIKQYIKSELQKILDNENSLLHISRVIELLKILKDKKINLQNGDIILEKINELENRFKNQIFTRIQSIIRNKSEDFYIESMREFLELSPFVFNKNEFERFEKTFRREIEKIKSN